MATLINKIVNDVTESYDLSSAGEARCAIDSVVDRLLEEVYDILNHQQGSMNQRADHARYLAEEIKWKLTTDFPHLDK